MTKLIQRHQSSVEQARLLKQLSCTKLESWLLKCIGSPLVAPPQCSHSRAVTYPIDPLLMLRASHVLSYLALSIFRWNHLSVRKAPWGQKPGNFEKGCIVNGIGIWSWANSSLYPTQLNHLPSNDIPNHNIHPDMQGCKLPQPSWSSSTNLIYI